MSFHWNLSSDDDNDDGDDVNVDGNDDDHQILSNQLLNGRYNSSTEEKYDISHADRTYSDQAQNVYGYNHENINDKYDDYDDEVDWEDAVSDDDDDNDDDRKPAASIVPNSNVSKQQQVSELRAVTIDLDKSAPVQNDDKDTKMSKKRKRRNIFRIHSLPNSMQLLLWNLHHTHLLALTSHAVHLSGFFSNPDLMALAYSLIPENICSQYQHRQQKKESSEHVKLSCPTLQQLNQFVTEWYIPFVHDVEDRRRQQQYMNRLAGAPTTRNYNNKNRRRSVNRNTKSSATNVSNEEHNVGGCSDTSDISTLLGMFTSYLSNTNDDDPQVSVQQTTAMLSILRNPTRKDQLITGLLVSMMRSLGWRARLVSAMEPMSPDLTVDHPLLTSFRNNIFTSIEQTSSKKIKMRRDDGKSQNDGMVNSNHQGKSLYWIEILCTDHRSKKKSQYRWFHVDPIHKIINQPDQVEILLGRRLQQETDTIIKRGVLAYAISVEHYLMYLPQQDRHIDGEDIPIQRLRLTDVTPRYAQSWIASLRKRGMIRNKHCAIEDEVQNSWWTKTLHVINAIHRPTTSKTNQHSTTNGYKNDSTSLGVVDCRDEKSHVKLMESLEDFDQVEHYENDELVASANNEEIPTNKAAFKTHPIYVIPSELGKTEVLHPDAKKRVCGVFKGQLVYRRSDVTTILTAKKWLYDGRKVRDDELNKPIKTPTKRKKPPVTGFKALRSYGVGETNDGNEQHQMYQGSIPLDDDTDKLYGIWQTDMWSPTYVGPNDDIPKNEYNNIELALLNPGLVHIDQSGLANVAKKLGIPYAPCLVGFEGHGGNRTPTIRGIVVHEHNEPIIREAGIEVQSYEIEQQCKDRRRSLLLMWKRLMVGLLTKDRLDREYGTSTENE
jgi:xeroderma pigmentosum group C-complementing protein